MATPPASTVAATATGANHRNRRDIVRDIAAPPACIMRRAPCDLAEEIHRRIASPAYAGRLPAVSWLRPLYRCRCRMRALTYAVAGRRGRGAARHRTAAGLAGGGLRRGHRPGRADRARSGPPRRL